MLNNVVLIGRLVRDPELRTTTTGKSVCSFSIAVQKRFKPTDGSADADFFNITAWNKDAEYVENYLTKGRLIAIQGRLQTRKYQASDGSDREVTEVVAEQVQGLDRPSGATDAKIAKSSSPPAVDEYDPFKDE
jgi:single-strand DNA-binding protein